MSDNPRQTSPEGVPGDTPPVYRVGLTPPQEAVVLALGRGLLLPLDDLLTVSQAFIHPGITHSDLAGCLNRHQVAGLRDLPVEGEPPDQVRKSAKDYDPGYFCIHAERLPDGGAGPRHLLVATDRATRWTCLELVDQLTPELAGAFVERLVQSAPFRVTRLLTDDRPAFTGSRSDGSHPFARACDRLDVRHFLVRFPNPQGDTLAGIIMKPGDFSGSPHFQATEGLAETLSRYRTLYNEQIAQTGLGNVTPLHVAEAWQERLSKGMTGRPAGNFPPLYVILVFCAWIAMSLFLASR